MKTAGIFVLILIFPFTLLGQYRVSEEERYEYAKTYRESKVFKYQQKQHRLEEMYAYEREVSSRARRKLESIEIRRRNRSSLSFVEKKEASLRHNKMLKAPDYQSYRIYNQSLPENARILFFDEDGKELIKIAEPTSNSTVLIIYPNSTANSERILAIGYIKVERGSIFKIEVKKSTGSIYIPEGEREY